jgi:hypothetical protein
MLGRVRCPGSQTPRHTRARALGRKGRDTPLTIVNRAKTVRWVGTRQAHAYPMGKDYIGSRSLCGRAELIEGLRVSMDSGNPRCAECQWVFARV